MDATSNKDYGALLLNMGGPASLEQIQPYLFELFSDPFIIQLPLGGIFQKWFAKFISARRAEKVRERYAAIGGKSPVREETEKLAAALAQLINAPVRCAMRYTSPRASDALRELTAQGAQKIVAIPLFPQYSLATTASALADFKAQVRGDFSYTIIENHFAHPGYLKALSGLLSQAIKDISPGLKTHVLFAAHGIPESYTQKGDPYIGQVIKTVDALKQKISPEVSSSLAFQSRLGPVKWHGPSLEEELAALAAKGIEQMVVQPVSFVTENLETLYDLDIDFRKKCKTAGIKKFIRVPCPARSAQYVEALSDLVMGTLKSGKWENAHA